MAQESPKKTPQERPQIPSDVLEFQPDGLEIEHQPVPLLARVTLYLLVALFGTFLTWSCVAEMDKIVSTRGQILSTVQDVMIQPMVTSIVRDLQVQVGQVLKKGQVLVTLDPTFAQADARQLDQRLVTLGLRMERLQAEIDGTSFSPSIAEPVAEVQLQKRIFEGRRQEYAARMHTYETEQQEYKAVLRESEVQLVQRREQLKIFKEVEGLHKDLFERGVQSRVEMLQAKNQVHSMVVEASTLESLIQEHRHALAKAVEEQKAFTCSWLRETARELDEVRAEYDSLQQQATKARRMKELVHLVSPMECVVLEIGDYAPGAVVREGEAIMRLAPLNVPLEAEVEVSAADIGYLRPGDVCRIKLDTFPFQRHGTLDGAVRVLSEDAFQSRTTPEKPLMYRGRIAVTSKDLRQVPLDFRLLPGMSLTAEVKVGTRKVITYFLYPLIKMFDEGMRTP